MENISDDEKLKKEIFSGQINYLKCHLEATLREFWYSALDMLPKLGRKELRVLIPFATYLSESRFSSLFSIRINSRNSTNRRGTCRSFPYFEKNDEYNARAKKSLNFMFTFVIHFTVYNFLD